MQNHLNYDSIVPLYSQIVERLRNDIEKGAYGETGRLPTEDELCEQYQVSRSTIRRAVNEMVEQHLVEKKQGKGTFICTPKLSRHLDCPMSFTEMCQTNGLTASAKILRAEIAAPESQEVRELLRLKDGALAVRICRLRYAGGRPLVLEDNYFPIEYAYLLSLDLEHTSLYRYLREEKGLTLRRTSMRLSIVRADAKIAKILQVPKSAPQLEMKGCVIQPGGQPVHSSYQIGYGENFEFIVS